MYEDFYQLRTNPFRLSPDPHFLFASGSHSRALAYLQYGLRMGEGFVVVTGAIGTGKTILAQHLLASLEGEQDLIAQELVTTQVDASDVLRLICASFGMSPRESSKAVLLDELKTYLLEQAGNGKRVVLVVDEAQNLPGRSLEELRMLSNFQQRGRPLLQTLLLGQMEFWDTLQGAGMEQFRQRVIASHCLRPLPAEETRKYIEHRLALGGWEKGAIFTRGAYTAVHEETQGIPRRINLLCDRILLYGALRELTKISLNVVRKVLAELQEELPMHQSETEGGDNSLNDLQDPDGAVTQASGTVSVTERRVRVLEQRFDELQAQVEQVRKEISAIRDETGCAQVGSIAAGDAGGLRKRDKV